MFLKNKNFKTTDEIINFQIKDPTASKVGEFYEVDPFPNYEINDDINKILQIEDEVLKDWLFNKKKENSVPINNVSKKLKQMKKCVYTCFGL